jgi:hypothetical protein
MDYFVFFVCENVVKVIETRKYAFVIVWRDISLITCPPSKRALSHDSHAHWQRGNRTGQPIANAAAEFNLLLCRLRSSHEQRF